MIEYVVVTKLTLRWLIATMLIGWLLSLYLIVDGVDTYEENVVYCGKIQDLQQELEISKAEIESCIMENSLLNDKVDEVVQKFS